MALDYPEQARYYELNAEQVDILFLAAWWYNGKPLGIDGEQYRMGTDHEMRMEEMFRAWESEEYRWHEPAHDELLERGLLREEYICRRKIDWVLSETALRAIRDMFRPRVEALDLRPEWAGEGADGPIFGDPNELLLHRKGVEVAAASLGMLAWCAGVEFYPSSGGDGEVADLVIRRRGDWPDWSVEVLTDTHNSAQWTAKWRAYSASDRNVLWVFEDRGTMCRFFNMLSNAGEYSLDGGVFSKPYSNVSAAAVTRKLWRSKSLNEGRGEAGDLAQTITGVFEAGPEVVADWFIEHYDANGKW